MLESVASAVRDSSGNVAKLVIVNRDITERKRAEQQLEHNLYHDPLTGMPNRRLFLDRLEQALLNLMANAIKFNRPGGEVRVSAEDQSGHVAIVIADTGVGIPSQDVPRIFERFYRVDKARSRQVGGTGLGLSIVKHVVERMKGAITVESQLGKGSTFTLLLPSTDTPQRGALL